MCVCTHTQVCVHTHTQARVHTHTHIHGRVRAAARAQAQTCGRTQPNKKTTDTGPNWSAACCGQHLRPESLDEVWVFFPDPWLAQGDAGRRVLRHETVALMHRCLRARGQVRQTLTTP